MLFASFIVGNNAERVICRRHFNSTVCVCQVVSRRRRSAHLSTDSEQQKERGNIAAPSISIQEATPPSASAVLTRSRTERSITLKVRPPSVARPPSWQCRLRRRRRFYPLLFHLRRRPDPAAVLPGPPAPPRPMNARGGDATSATLLPHLTFSPRVVRERNRCRRLIIMLAELTTSDTTTAVPCHGDRDRRR